VSAPWRHLNLNQRRFKENMQFEEAIWGFFDRFRAIERGPISLTELKEIL